MDVDVEVDAVGVWVDEYNEEGAGEAEEVDGWENRAWMDDPGGEVA